MKLSTLVIGVLAVGLLAQFTPSARGEEFGPNVRVNADTNLDRNVPVLAVGWDGTVYAAWQDKSSGYWRIMFAHAPGSGGSFTGHLQVSTPGVPAAIQQSPDIAYWNETIYVVWQETSGSSYVIMFSSVSMPTGLPSIAKMIASGLVDEPCFSPSIAVGPNGTIYVAYSDSYTQIRLVASYDRGNTWPVNSLVAANAGNTRGEQRVAVDPWGKVYVVWRDGRSGMIDRPGGIQVEDDDVYIANSTDGGNTFGPNTPVNDVVAGKVQSSPSIAIDGYGRLHVAWKDERLESNECTDIFYANSDDGVSFGPNVPVNDTSPIAMSPKRTTHQQPWIQVEPTGQVIYIAWVDDRSGNHNVFLAKSVDGGQTFHPAHDVEVAGGLLAGVFIDDASSYNGYYDTAEVAMADNGDGVFSPGVLDGSPDKVIIAGLANLGEDLTGDYLRFHDSDTNGIWSSDEDIVVSGPSGAASAILPYLFAPWDTTSQSISLLYFNDDTPMSVDPAMVMAVESFDTDSAGLAPTDPISNASIELRYRADSSYTGTADVNWAIQGSANNSWFAPVDTGNAWTNVSLNLYSLGVTTVANLQDLNVSFINNGAGTVFFDRINLNLTMGIPDRFDVLDVIVYDGATATNLDDPLRNFAASDRIVFVDVNMTGHYDRGDPIIRTSTVVGSGGLLRASDEVLTRADGPRWRTLFNPFPVNDDKSDSSHFMPRIVLNPFNYITAMWQDWRGSGGPNIYASTADVSASYGPHMTFYMQTNRSRAGPGGMVDYEIWIRNTGGISAKDVNVSNVLPAGLDFVTSSPLPNQTIGQERKWSFGFLSSLGYRSIAVRARVNASVQLDTVLRTTATLSFTDILGGARPEKYGWIEFIASDLEPPTITHTPPGDAKTGDTLTFTGHVADNTGIAKVKLYVKPVGASYFNTPIETTDIPGGDFSISYNVGSSAGTLEYYLEAVDIYGNVATSPAGAPTDTHKISVSSQTDLDLGAVAVIAGGLLLVGAILAVVLFVVLRRRKREPPIEEDDEWELLQPPPA